MSDVTVSFTIGETFSSYSEFQLKLDRYEEATSNKLYKRDCRTIDAAKKRATKKNFNPALIYAALHFCCIHGGKYRSRSTGARPNQRSIKLGCPMELKLATTGDGQELLVTGFFGEHIHYESMGSKESPELDSSEEKGDHVQIQMEEDSDREISVTKIEPIPHVEEYIDRPINSVQRLKSARKAIPRKVMIRDHLSRTMQSAPLEIHDKRSYTSFEEDEEALFGKLIAGRLRKIPDDMIRQNTKLKILGIIFQAEFGVSPEPLSREQDDMTLSSTVVVCNEER